MSAYYGRLEHYTELRIKLDYDAGHLEFCAFSLFFNVKNLHFYFFLLFAPSGWFLWLICSVILYEIVGVVSSESRQYEENRKEIS